MARLKVLLSAFSICILASVASAEQPFPYVAYVVGPESSVRSGPGQQYYPTDRLQSGYAVEVYRHDDQGWCAIRPPEGSFSWVPAHQVRIVAGQVGRVVADQTVARVGSGLSPARSNVQVLLKGGEQVELIDGGPVGDGRWLRIAAPAGEFRWISAKALSLQPPMETELPTVIPAAATVPSVAATTTWRSQSQRNAAPPQPAPPVRTDPTPQPFQHLQSRAIPNQYPTPSPTLASSPPNENGALNVVAGSPAELQLAEGLPANLSQSTGPPRVRFGGGSVSPGSVLPGNTSIGNIDERIGELQLRLSQTVVQPTDSWRFVQLRDEANAMLQQAQSSEARNQLRDLLDRIARFEHVQTGNNQLAARQLSAENRAATGVRSETAMENTDDESLLTDAAASIRRRVARDFSEPSAKDNHQEETRYDAVGMLKPVVSKKSGAPQFALVDKKGDVLSFVTPTPDLNLNPYVGRRIGVHGTRGYLSEYRRAHVTASRVTTIEKTIEKSVLR